MKIRIVRTPTLTGQPNYFWYTAQIKRGPFWVDCRNDIILQMKYSIQMLEGSRDMHLERVEKTIRGILEGVELYPAHDKAVVIKIYE